MLVAMEISISGNLKERAVEIRRKGSGIRRKGSGKTQGSNKKIILYELHRSG